MPKNSFTLPSFAKINWFLRVLGKREDGFHEICTVFQTVSLQDNLTFTKSDKLDLKCSDEKIPVGEENLIIKAAKILSEKFRIKKGAEIYLEKNIPAPGGLGGGSSNAAIALIGLSKLWNLPIDLEKLTQISKKIGSDVPFFLCGGTAFGTGRGTDLTALEDAKEEYILIVTPQVDVSTAKAFGQLNARHLTNNDSKSILKICRDAADTFDLRQSNLVNDFERTVFKIESEIESVKKKLLFSGATFALMSGSGASVFGVFESSEKLQKAFSELEKEKSWRVFRVRTISKPEYFQFLGLEKMFVST